MVISLYKHNVEAPFSIRYNTGHDTSHENYNLMYCTRERWGGGKMMSLTLI